MQCSPRIVSLVETMPTSAVLDPVDAIAKRLFRCQNGASRKIRFAFATSFTIWLYFTVTTYSKINRHHDLIGMKTPIALDSYKESRVNTGRSETRRTSIRYRSQQSMSNVTKEATKTSWGSDFEAAEQNRKKNNCTVHHSYEDIKRCVPPERRKNMTLMMKPGDPPCDTITTWSDIQRCVNGPTAPKPVVELERMRINLIGERNSGTKWIVEEMQKCFPKEKFGVKIERDLYGRNKHFFQLTGRNSLQRRHVVVSVFRDPVEWVAAMIEKPYHMPYHMQGPYSLRSRLLGFGRFFSSIKVRRCPHVHNLFAHTHFQALMIMTSRYHWIGKILSTGPGQCRIDQGKISLCWTK